MKLYVKNGEGKVYLREVAPSRQLLARKIGGSRFLVNGRRYSVNEVVAESGRTGASTGLVIGGLLGILVSPVAAIAAGTIGGLIGNSNDSQEEEIVNNFNSSRVENETY